MNIQLSDHFTISKLLRFTLPSMAMMVLTSIYSVVDGLFVSNFVGDAALAAVNIVTPLPLAIGAFGVMLSTGGSGEVSRALGLGDGQRAKEYFSTLICTALVLGLILSGLGVVFIRPLCALLGADEALLELCVAYGTITVSGGAAFMLQTVFQSFCTVAGRPKLGFSLSLAAGVTNMVLDGLFIAVLGWGVKGAALATLCGYLVGSAAPLVYFLRDNGTPLRLVLPRRDREMLTRACYNGSSEFMSNLSASLVTALYNRCLMGLIGEPGVAAYTVMMYVQYVSSAILIGFSMGSAPLFTLQYGAGNVREFRNLFRKGLVTVCALSAGLTLLSQLLATPMAHIFVGYNEALLAMTVTGFRRFALSFLLCGVSIFASALFTALGDGTASAVISFLRTLVFQCGAILLLPALMGLNGVWWCAVLAEGLALAVSAAMLFLKRKRYKYI